MFLIYSLILVKELLVNLNLEGIAQSFRNQIEGMGICSYI